MVKEETKKEGKEEMVKSEQTPSLSPFGKANSWFTDVMPRPFGKANSWFTDVMPRSFWNADKLVADALRRPFALVNFPRLLSTEEIMPDVDIFEDGGDIVVKAELPGIKKDDLEVTLTDDDITISGEKRKEEKIKKKGYYKWERSYGSFCRTFSLPAKIQSDKVRSTFKDGVLEIRMPKSETATSKEVKVKVE
jgi:HSP20 family protein